MREQKEDQFSQYLASERHGKFHSHLLLGDS